MMKKLILSVVVIGFFGCKEQVQKKEPITKDATTTVEQDHKKFPEDLNKVFDAHGGFDNWKGYRSLSFDLPKGDIKETHYIDLITRKDKITMDANDVSLGFDGDQVWLSDPKGEYKGDPVFYHNLMFYFYTMPFVFGDDGINYEEAENLEFEGVSYPGILITYNSGVGASPKDEYYLYYNPDTFQMEWLGYTVTYRTGEASDKVNWIRYNDWMKVEEVVLPKSISWYTHEDKKMIGVRNTVSFENVVLQKTSKDNGFYDKPDGGSYVNGKK